MQTACMIAGGRPGEGAGIHRKICTNMAEDVCNLQIMRKRADRRFIKDHGPAKELYRKLYL